MLNDKFAQTLDATASAQPSKKELFAIARELAVSLRPPNAPAPTMTEIVKECRIVREKNFKAGKHKKQYRHP